MPKGVYSHKHTPWNKGLGKAIKKDILLMSDGSKVIKISLTQNKFALIDDEDFERVNQFKWGYSSNGYAKRGIWDNAIQNNRYQSLHRFIMKNPKGFYIDHINGNKLDNRKENLRLASKAQNAMNVKKRVNNKFPYKGIGFNPTNGKKYFAYINNNGKRIHLGSFFTVIEAAKAYDKAAIELFGEFACLNFPQERMED